MPEWLIACIVMVVMGVTIWGINQYQKDEIKSEQIVTLYTKNGPIIFRAYPQEVWSNDYYNIDFTDINGIKHSFYGSHKVNSRKYTRNSP